ncbi:hypothetical protein [Streptomyces canarius]
MAKKTYHGTDSLVKTHADGVPVGGTSGLTDTAAQGGRTSVLSSY